MYKWSGSITTSVGNIWSSFHTPTGKWNQTRSTVPDRRTVSTWSYWQWETSRAGRLLLNSYHTCIPTDWLCNTPLYLLVRMPTCMSFSHQNVGLLHAKRILPYNSPYSRIHVIYIKMAAKFLVILKAAFLGWFTTVLVKILHCWWVRVWVAGWSGRDVLGDERLFGQFFCAKFYEKFDNSGAKWQGGREVSARCVRGDG